VRFVLVQLAASQNGISDELTLNVQMYGHLVAAVGVAGDAIIASAVVPGGADEAEDTGGALGRVEVLDHVAVIGDGGLQLRSGLAPDYL
jgi:hypothetical protein